MFYFTISAMVLNIFIFYALLFSIISEDNGELTNQIQEKDPESNLCSSIMFRGSIAFYARLW